MEIKIYIDPNCEWCNKLKDWMKKENLSYQELDVTESDTYRDELLEKSSQLAVPVIDIDGEIIVGFNEQKIKEVLNKAKVKV